MLEHNYCINKKTREKANQRYNLEDKVEYLWPQSRERSLKQSTKSTNYKGKYWQFTLSITYHSVTFKWRILVVNINHKENESISYRVGEDTAGLVAEKWLVLGYIKNPCVLLRNIT